MSSNKLVITPASEWKKRTYIMELPSGKVVEVQRVNASALITQDGTVPNDLFPHMVKVIQGSISEGEATKDPHVIKAGLLLATQITCQALVSPRIVDDPDYEAGEIHIDDVDDADRQFISIWATNGGDEKKLLKRFRDKLPAGASASQHGKSLRHKTVTVPGA